MHIAIELVEMRLERMINHDCLYHCCSDIKAAAGDVETPSPLWIFGYGDDTGDEISLLVCFSSLVFIFIYVHAFGWFSV